MKDLLKAFTLLFVLITLLQFSLTGKIPWIRGGHPLTWDITNLSNRPATFIAGQDTITIPPLTTFTYKGDR